MRVNRLRFSVLKITISWDGKAISYPSEQTEITGMRVERVRAAKPACGVIL